MERHVGQCAWHTTGKANGQPREGGEWGRPGGGTGPVSEGPLTSQQGAGNSFPKERATNTCGEQGSQSGEGLGCQKTWQVTVGNMDSLGEVPWAAPSSALLLCISFVYYL